MYIHQLDKARDILVSYTHRQVGDRGVALFAGMTPAHNLTIVFREPTVATCWCPAVGFLNTITTPAYGANPQLFLH